MMGMALWSSPAWRHRAALVAVAGFGLILLTAPLPTGSKDAAAHTQTQKALQTAQSWGYQLQNPDPFEVARSRCDVVVTDYSREGDDETAFKRTDVERMQSGNGEHRRIVLSYLSIGEAEDYRFYWQPGAQPEWLVGENTEWSGNYHIEYWNQDWQRIIFGSPESYLDRIIAAGFDGVYLDRVDAYLEWGNSPNAMRRMVDFVVAIGQYSRRLKDDFIVTVQNGENLLQFSAYLRAIDAVAKEDLFYGVDGDAIPNQRDESRSSIAYLQKAQRQGLPVFLVEYTDNPKQIATVRTRASELKFVPLFTDRELKSPPDCWAD